MKTLQNCQYIFQSLTLTILPLRKDNYSYIIHDADTQQTLIIDPSETEPIRLWLKEKKLSLTHILNTHHHNDHTEGNLGLKAAFPAKLFAPGYDAEKGRIAGEPDALLRGGETFCFGKYSFSVMATPGHTLGHICLHLADAQWLFSGDTLFSLGCGRLFEGTPELMWKSFLQLRRLPDQTLVFCGHEYTLANAEFLHDKIDDSLEFVAFYQSLRQRMAIENKTIPAKFENEKQFNPYLRADHESLRKFGDSPVEVFAAIRLLKDQYAG